MAGPQERTARGSRFSGRAAGTPYVRPALPCPKSRTILQSEVLLAANGDAIMARTLDELVAYLDRLEERAPLDELVAELSELQIKPADVAQHTRFSSRTYMRNLV